MYFVGGGVAVFDCDDDGRQDLYLAGGEEPAALYRNRSPAGGALAFEAIPGKATDLRQVTGAYPIDIDGDDVDDLAVLRVGENVLLRGLGDCAFERANEAWGYDGGDAWTTAFSATWESPDGLPTMAFGNYLVPDTVEDGTLRVRRPRTGASRAPMRRPTTRRPRCPLACARSRCSSATGIGPAGAICGRRTTGITRWPPRSSCGAWNRARRRTPGPLRRAGRR